MSDAIDWNDDPRLVAYALGELGGADLEEVERALLADPACRVALDELRSFLPEVQTAVRAGAADAGLESAARDRIAAAARLGPARRRPIWRQPALAAAAAVVLAAVGARSYLNRQPLTPDVQVATGEETFEGQADGDASDSQPAGGRLAGGSDADGGSLKKGEMARKRGTRTGDARERGRRGAAAGADPADAPAERRSELLLEKSREFDQIGAVAESDAAPLFDSETADRGLVGEPAERPDASRSVEAPGEAAPPMPKASTPQPTVDPTGAPTGADDFFLGRGQADAPAREAESASQNLDFDEAESEEAVVEEFEVRDEILERTLSEDVRSKLDRKGVDKDDLRRQRRRLELVENPFVLTESDAMSTFSIDVDTASYTNVRRSIQRGNYPSPFDVRIEEFVNYFSYDDVPPSMDDPHPFRVTVETGAAPWNPQNRLVRIGLAGEAIEYGERAAANLVFLVDVSGSMDSEDKLPLVKDALAMLTDSLEPNDRVAIVVYASSQGLALPSTPVAARESILQSLERLDAGGSTNGGAGIQLAYSVATEHFVEGGVNRVVLCTDGDFNVGVTSDEGLEDLIAEKARSGIDLTVLGFGTGNFQDKKMEALSNRGNGNFAYIDSEAEARKVLVTEVGGTLVTIAKDVKIQVVWNPAMVRAARLIGYENRMLEHADFRDDSKDAGEIGAGHGVTALYEVVPFGAAMDVATADPGKPDAAALEEAGGAEPTGPFVTVQLRYKPPGQETSVEFVVEAIDTGASFDAAPRSLRFAAAVAAFGMILRESAHVGEATLQDVRRWALESLGEDPGGLGAGFVELVDGAIDLKR